MTLPGLTTLNVYTLLADPEAFADASTALAERVRSEGESGVLSYRFFVNGPAGLARAVVDYRDGAAWIGHHEKSMGWPEMKALHSVARLADVTFLGRYPDEVRDWLAGSSLTATLNIGFDLTTGFNRGADPATLSGPGG